MGQNTRSQGVSFTHEMWERIDERCRELKCGRSQYFQMLVEQDLLFQPQIHAHRADGRWHFFPESDVPLKVAEPPGKYHRSDKRTPRSS